MSNTDNAEFGIIANDEHEFSIWPTHCKLLPQWHYTGPTGTQAEMQDLLSRQFLTTLTPTGSVLRDKVFLEQYGDFALVNVNGRPGRLARLVPKRIFDLLLATIALVFLSPLFLLIALAIRFDSKGPVVYRQPRLGKNGRPFTFYKFRSMSVGADKEKGRVRQIAEFIKNKEKANGSTKIVDECKITRVGKFLRKMSFDELPQLFNVLKGDMSLVGPRPEVQKFVDLPRPAWRPSPGRVSSG